ncbi:PREDICTED: uncharacterized protein LOC107334207 [Acropora digitifera]|uniref:uncharacterized protein LOC107334207 n=1 Tax=Acropora digitifera TaxID=70779 RepID=UPI00077AE73F|nr:PREDICTED: uncharacterized protein LOC107334207 [Acropora digitifera]
MFRCVLPCKKRKNKEVSWSTGENPFSLSGSCFSSENSSCDGSDSDFNIPEEIPQYIKKLAPRAEFDNYEFGKMLGAGGFGQVISATQKKDNLPVAIKFVHKSSMRIEVKLEKAKYNNFQALLP